jgi:hypothetical protein
MASAPVDVAIRLKRDRHRLLEAFIDRQVSDAGRLTWPLDRLGHQRVRVVHETETGEDRPRIPSTTSGHPGASCPVPWSATCLGG